jgi:hypothetical protein
MKKHLILFLVVCGLLLSAGKISSAQNAPVTTCGNVSVSAPGNFTLPVSVTNFTNIGAISLTIDYNYSVAEFVLGTPHPSLPTFLLGDSDLGNGFHRITMGWFGSATSLADGSVIMTLTFNYVSGNSELTWYDDGSSCEYADGSYNILNDVPQGTYYINGNICAVVETPGPVTGDTSVCQGEQGLTYSIDQVPNATGYTWSVPQGATITSGQNTNFITVDYPAGSVSGFVSVFAFSPCGSSDMSQLDVTVNDLPIASAGDDLTINYGTSTTLQAAPGGPGTYSYHWSPEELLVDPDVQNPQTVIMTSSAVFILLVTEQTTLCQSTDEVVVTITGGPLSVNPIAIPGSVCSGEYAQLHANAGGGSGNYTYQWTCLPADDPPWGSNLANPVVSPDSSKHYLLSVYDGFTITGGSTDLMVFQLPSATISGGDTLCGSGSFAYLTVDLTGTPPWSFIYSNGVTSVQILNQFTTPYIIITADPGTYTILEVADIHCFGTSSGSATVGVFPVPATPEITINVNELMSSSCCGNQWYLNNEPIDGATGQFYTATVSGEYFVIVTLNGCSSDTSEVVDIIVGIGEVDAGDMLIYPNPAHDRVSIRSFSHNSEPVFVRLYTLDGRLIRSARFIYSSSNQENVLEINQVPPGLYILQILSGKTVSVKKLEVR